jgi:uncharacterized iron-regulated membrane protein
MGRLTGSSITGLYMQSIRTWHTYIGILIAPSVLFFAFTGSLQLFSLHEAHDSYKPPPVIEKLASVHKDQVFALKEHDHEPEPSAGTQPQRTSRGIRRKKTRGPLSGPAS